jgi:DNA-binding response OmpR family regulator
MPYEKTVLHIDDNQEITDLLVALFEDCPLNWVVARTGQEGLEKARERQPDLILLDLMLPDISGREVFMQIQADAELQHIPVWVLSVIWWNANRFPWHEPGIVSYTFKPFEPYELRDRVLDLLGVK